MGRKRYWMANGFHHSSTYVLVAEGEVVPGDIMRRADRRLCSSSDCTCSSSMASNARPDQRQGIDGRPDLTLVPVDMFGTPAQRREWRDDRDAYVLMAREAVADMV